MFWSQLILYCLGAKLNKKIEKKIFNSKKISMIKKHLIWRSLPVINGWKLIIRVNQAWNCQIWVKCVIDNWLIEESQIPYFPRNYSFLTWEIQRSQYMRPKVTVHKGAETIQGRKLFKGGNYMRKYGISIT